jgi:glycine cleavage system regulatory protein
MQTSLVLTVIGEDKPGLVESVSEVVSELGGNWLESSMARLDGKFAGIVRVTIDQEKAATLISALQGLQARGLRVLAEPSGMRGTATGLRLMTLELVGGDRVGIVHDVSQALAQRHVNVEDLHTQCTSAPMSGKQLFHASAKLGVPASVDIDELRQALEKIAADLIVDIVLDDLSDDT